MTRLIKNPTSGPTRYPRKHVERFLRIRDTSKLFQGYHIHHCQQGILAPVMLNLQK